MARDRSGPRTTRTIYSASGVVSIEGEMALGAAGQRQVIDGLDAQGEGPADMLSEELAKLSFARRVIGLRNSQLGAIGLGLHKHPRLVPDRLADLDPVDCRKCAMTV
jgi:hypothetical protein